MTPFESRLKALGTPLRRAGLETLQINVGRKCNQACRHCHVDAAPWRTEMMTTATAERIGAWIGQHRPPVIDLTGGAPELNPAFKYFVELGRASGARVLDRNNLTILTEPGFEDLANYLAAHQVEIIASLPCYLESNVNRQRGAGVFARSIEGLRRLNAVGYGTKLPLHLVYNPLGPQLPPSQAELEADYKQALLRDYGILFHNLFTIANQPIARFAEDLRQRGEWESYLDLLANSFNPATLPGLMCRSTLSVGYDGLVYDCDFNQMLHLPLAAAQPAYLWEIDPAKLPERPIATGPHCYACTAGAGSSCTGALAA